MQEFLDNIRRVYDADVNERAGMLTSLLRLAETNGECINRADLHLIRGYAAYHFPDLVQSSLNVEDELKAVLAERPSDSTARFYLACHYFDIGKFEQARSHLRQLKSVDYLAAGQGWKSIKIDEMIICCEARAGNYRQFIDLFSLLIAKMSSMSCDQVPAPTEVVACIEECGQDILRSLGVYVYRQCLSLLQTYVRFAAMEDSFQNRIDALYLAVGGRKGDEAGHGE